MSIIEKLVVGILSLMVTFLLYLTCIILPVNMSNQSTCLANGYDRTHTTLTLASYCSKTNNTTIVVPVK